MSYKQNIKRLLKEKGFSYKSIANKLNVSENNISTTLNSPKSMQADTLQRYADALGVPLWQLFVQPGDVTETVRYQPTAICPHCGKPLQIKIE